MTTIVYRNGILAADTLVVTGNLVTGRTSKICKIPETEKNPQCLIAGSGCISAITGFFQWAKELTWKDGAPSWTDSEPLEVDEEFTGLILTPNQSYILDSHGYPCPISAPFIAIGSGRGVALGALQQGASAVDAVFAAMAWDVYTGGAIETLSFCDVGSGV